jgi:hypothetical protein
MPLTKKLSLACAAVGVLAIAGCGSSSNSKTNAASSGGGGGSASSTTHTAGGSSSQGAGALSADVHSAATGDIPDNQIFLVFTNKAGRYAIKYPEGWTQSGSGRSVTFRNKNNLVRVVIAPGSPPSPSSVSSQLNRLKKSNPTLQFRAPQTITIGSSPAVKAVYTTQSAPNPVTGKRVLLIVDRYELHRGGSVATVDLGTPKGVDNVDAYRKMIESFRWL